MDTQTCQIEKFDNVAEVAIFLLSINGHYQGQVFFEKAKSLTSGAVPRGKRFTCWEYVLFREIHFSSRPPRLTSVRIQFIQKSQSEN